MSYHVERYKPDTDDDDDEAWDADDWAWLVLDDSMDIICICSTQEEANHITKLLDMEPYVASATTGQ